MTQVILGTAGHIDHGKTALIKALTGIDLDRLKEEKERGITIELGFASLPLSSDQRIGIVDVPGHEKFIRRMVAGAGGIDIVMLIVAADDGVMPQTREHFHICKLLDIKHGIIVITKKDLVEPDWIEMVKEDITQMVNGSFLQGAPIIPVSSITGEGVPQLVTALREIVPKINPKSSVGLSFLPIDRIFTMKGFGTVATGTLISGKIAVGENLEILPDNIKVKARGIQVYNEPVAFALAGQRTAVNLQGAEKTLLTRGDVLSHPDALRPSERFDVRLSLLAGMEHPLKHGDLSRIHLFTSQTMARIISYDGNVLAPGGSYYVQLRLSEPLVSIPGARFILRNPEATHTIGGGTILDPHPPRHRRSDPKTKVWFQTLTEKGVDEIITIFSKESGAKGITLTDLLRRVAAPKPQAEQVWRDLVARGVLREISPDTTQSIHGETLSEHTQKLRVLLKEYHQHHPLKPGIPLEEAKHKLGARIHEKFFEYLIQELREKGEIEVTGDLVHHTSHRIALNADQMKMKGEIEKLIFSRGLTPPTFRELLDTFHLPQDTMKNLLNLSAKEGVMVKVKDDLYFSKSHLVVLREKLINYLKEKKELTPADFKELTGVSRKYSIPLLEYFDREKLTMRIGDKRMLRDRKSLT